MAFYDNLSDEEITAGVRAAIAALPYQDDDGVVWPTRAAWLAAQSAETLA
jgi:hypothetical protein